MNINNLGLEGVQFVIDKENVVVSDLDMLENIADHLYSYVKFKKNYEEIKFKSEFIKQTPKDMLADIVKKIDNEYYYMYHEDIAMIGSFGMEIQSEELDNQKIIPKFKAILDVEFGENHQLLVGGEESFISVYTKDPDEMIKYLEYINNKFYVPYLVELK